MTTRSLAIGALLSILPGCPPPVTAPPQTAAATKTPAGRFDASRSETGRPAPPFTLLDVKGQPVSLEETRKDAGVVLVFYRGGW